MGPNRIPRRDWLLGTSASLITLAAASAGNAAALTQPGTPTPSPQPQAASEAEDADRIRRMKWWHEARFGMFIHLGLYSVLGRHEWAMEDEGIPVARIRTSRQTLSSRSRTPRAPGPSSPKQRARNTW